MMAGLTMIEISTNYEVEVLRNLRNECRNFMTRNTDLITEEQQKTWYKNLDKEKNKLYLLNKIEDGISTDIGYGYNRVEDSAVLLTGGLTESERGKGYGEVIFRNLMWEANKFDLPIRLEVLKTNINALCLYKKLGFIITEFDDKIIKMEYLDD